LETGTVRISFSAFSERKDILKLTGILERYAENYV